MVLGRVRATRGSCTAVIGSGVHTLDSSDNSQRLFIGGVLAGQDTGYVQRIVLNVDGAEQHARSYHGWTDARASEIWGLHAMSDLLDCGSKHWRLFRMVRVDAAVSIVQGRKAL